MSPAFSNKQIKTQVFKTVCMENRKLWYVIISFPWHCWVKLLLLPNVSVTISGSLLHERNCGHLNPHVLNVLSLETIMCIWNERNKNLHKLYTLKYTYCQTFQLIIEKPFSSLVMMHVAGEILHLFYLCSDGCNADSCWRNLAGVQTKLGMYMFVTLMLRIPTVLLYQKITLPHFVGNCLSFLVPEAHQNSIRLF